MNDLGIDKTKLPLPTTGKIHMNRIKDDGISRNMSPEHRERMEKHIVQCLETGLPTQLSIYESLVANDCVPVCGGKPMKYATLRAYMSRIKNGLGLHNPMSKNILKLHDEGNSVHNIVKLLGTTYKNTMNCLVYNQRIKPLVRQKSGSKDIKKMQILVSTDRIEKLNEFRAKRRYTISKIISDALDDYFVKHG